MNTEETLNLPDDTEGHSVNGKFADAETSETDDTEGHSVSGKVADAEASETDDTEGHTLGGIFADSEFDKKAAAQEADVVRP
jgi:hypothetical protein